jgi:cell division protein FtsA
VPVATTQNLLNCVNRAGIEVIEMVLEPLAAGAAALTTDEKELGVVLADIGGGTTEMAVWKGGALAHTSVIPVGGDHFTNDLAVVLKTPLADAERMKRKFGAAIVTLVPEEDTIEVSLTGGRGVHPVKRREVAEILQPRAEELLTLVWEEAVREVPSVELRAGLVLTGGGADLDGMLEVAEQVLGVTVRRGVPHGLGGLTEIVSAPEWTCAAGLLLYGKQPAPTRAKPSVTKKEKPGFFTKIFKTPIKDLFASQSA